jgi:hypothetical protein
MGYAIAAVIIALMLGFGAGLMTFKRSSMWCPGCGKTLRCDACDLQQESR